MFRALVIDKQNDQPQVAFKYLSTTDLPEAEVLVKVVYSTLNYKDALAITNSAPIVRHYPMVPGIDFAGIVEASTDSSYQVGELVLANGWGLGETHWGGLAEYARVPADFLIPVPAAFSLRDAMVIGTAGYTAMLCVLALEKQGVKPTDGEVLVTGAAGGVGSVAVALLSRLGYSVTAMTGRTEEAAYLKQLGATHIIDRAEYSQAGRPLAKERWAGAIDVAGGVVLANVCAAMKYQGVVAACGLAASMEFPANMAPFILRGVRLIGIDSVMCPKEQREQAWARLATDLDPQVLESVAKEITVDEVLEYAPLFLSGNIRGRLVVRLQPN